MSTEVNKSIEEDKTLLHPHFDPVLQTPVANLSPTMQIEREFNARGGLAVLGGPQADASPTLNNTGYYQNFANGWSIFRSPSTGAHEVHGDIRGKWAELGYERGFLGFPPTDETGTPADGREDAPMPPCRETGVLDTACRAANSIMTK